MIFIICISIFALLFYAISEVVKLNKYDLKEVSLKHYLFQNLKKMIGWIIFIVVIFCIAYRGTKLLFYIIFEIIGIVVMSIVIDSIVYLIYSMIKK